MLLKSISRLLCAIACVFFAGNLWAYTPPANNRHVYNLNYDWQFLKQDIDGPQAYNHNDAGWETVSLPHTWNDIDRYDDFIHGGGDLSGYQSRAWYRKHFKLNASLQGSKVFIEFEGIRQGAEIYINGTWVGRHENGVGPCGIDISDEVNFGGTDNVLAVSVDNRLGYVETATGVGFVWNTGPFNPIYGGLVGNARLHVTSKVYQTLPLYRNLQTSGPYVYASISM